MSNNTASAAEVLKVVIHRRSGSGGYAHSPHCPGAIPRRAIYRPVERALRRPQVFVRSDRADCGSDSQE